MNHTLLSLTNKKGKVLCLFLLLFLCILLGFFCWKRQSRLSLLHTLEEKTIPVEITIPGISNSYDLLFLTDSHVVNPDVKASAVPVQEIDYINSRYPMFLDEDGVPSLEVFSNWITFAREEKVDGLLLGGDIIDSPTQSNLDVLEKQLTSLEMPYVYTPGNHDWTYPWEYMTETGKLSYFPLLAPYMEGNPAFHTKDFGDFIVAAVDNSSGQVNPDVLPAYEALLQQGKPVIVLAHVPFLTQSVLPKATEAWNSPVVIGGGNYGGIYPNDASQKFIDMTTAKDSPVVAVLAGHVHFFDSDVIEGEKNVLQVVGDAGFHNHAVRLHIHG